MSTLANSVDPGEMPHTVAFHQGLHCLPRSSKKEIHYFFELITCNPSIHVYTMDHPDFIACSFIKKIALV